MRPDLNLQADCEKCFGLCCVAPAFSASPDFAIDKPAGQPCLHLRADFRCDIHVRLFDEGFVGCTLFDCYGAGQKVSLGTFGGRDWRRSPDLAGQMFAVFAVMRNLHTLLWYLANASDLRAVGPMRGELSTAAEEIQHLTYLDAAALLRLDVGEQQRKIGALLLRAGELVRAEVLGIFAADPRARWGTAELTRETGLEMASLAPILTRLVRAGWIAKEDGPEGGHYVHVQHHPGVLREPR
jgi:DNA-binding MarR family transcriptional regulator